MQEILLVERFCSSTRVMLPKQNRLIVDKFDARCSDNLSSELFALEKIEEIQAHRIFEKLCKLWLLPVEQVLQVVDEARILEIIALRKNFKREN